jgi:RimJ/RimL family protein N-acetyltransferase
MSSIETERMLLRMFVPEDLGGLTRLFTDPDVMRYVGNGQPVDLEGTRRAIEGIIKHWTTHGFGRWAAVDKHTHEFLGFGGLRSLFGTPEVVYHFAKAHWGRGLATELARASLRFGFENRQFDRIVAIAIPANLKSIHVMKKLGMRHEKEARYYDIDVTQYQINRDEFKIDDSFYLLRP